MEHPLLCNSDMVRAILNGQKTQTRRPIKPQPFGDIEYWKCTPRDWSGWKKADNAYGEVEVYPCNTFSGITCPFGDPGDVLRVRETHYRLGKWSINGKTETGRPKWRFSGLQKDSHLSFGPPPGTVRPNKFRDFGWYKRRSIHMPKWACRLRLTVKRVWVEQVQSISEADAEAEGMDCDRTYLEDFEYIWNSIYGPDAWDRNDWVFATEFEVQK